MQKWIVLFKCRIEHGTIVTSVTRVMRLVTVIIVLYCYNAVKEIGICSFVAAGLNNVVSQFVGHRFLWCAWPLRE